ncbi:helix-turn-helix transcriptional regulator [Thiothrix litoralis]|uniref:Helix-turn-helix transcriptional regulator n=1 Tax=Thiothrix litoralis TaxID=2891210 RepID=A0ABX7WTH7_9GAMM|nr:helix-turn-helix transcriptional regulator [Thiothrix litoralis]QTR45693.1 helix-turn-helix transcriptional regulator [Thiothrix litoralis]
MSSKDFADYLGQRVARLGLSKSEVARRADISRQTWYRLLSAEVTDAKLSTMARLAEALETTPLHLLSIYFGEETTGDVVHLHAPANNHRRAQA